MFNIVLYQPEIPPNTGNVIRLCANTGCRLHLIQPLGFTLEDSQLKRAGLDYHEYAQIQVHRDWAAFRNQFPLAKPYAFSTKATRRFDQARFQRDDILVFGPESRGLPDDLLASFDPQQGLRLPMVPGSRSLNLSNTVAVVVFEAWRQLGFEGM